MSNAAHEAGPSAILAGLIAGARDAVDFDDPATIADLGSIRDEVVLPALQAHRGQLVEAADVDILVGFESVVDAAAGALAIQTGMAARNASCDEPQRYSFRFGLDLEGGRGPGGTLAGAIAAACDPGDVWMGDAVEAALRGRVAAEPKHCGVRPIGPDGEVLQLYRLGPERRNAAPNPTPAPAAPPPQRADVREGVVLNDTYRIESLIAQGGMGEVFKGHEIHSGGVVAVKLIRSDMTSSKVALGLFQKEALILKDIYHDAIVRYFMFSFDPNLHRHYLAMEFVDGVSLAELLKKGPLPFEAVCTLQRRIASALFVAHERGIIHRDMSPDNIIIPGQNLARAKIIDFGIARASEIGGGTLIGGGFAGKYNYVSPEQLGLAGGEVTPRSDIYSLGLVLAEASLGAPLDMNGSQAEVIEKRRKVPDLGDLDPRLRPLIERMLQPDPNDRPASMAVVADWPKPGDAAVVSPGQGEDAERAAAEEKERRRRRRQHQRWRTAAAIALAVVVAGGFAAARFWPDRLTRTTSVGPHDLSLGPADISPPPESHLTDANSKPSASIAQPGDLSTQPIPPVPSVTPGPPPPEAAKPLPPPVVTRPPLVRETGPDAMAAYVRAYGASPCFVVKPVQFTATTALVEAFGLSRDDFSAFDQGFAAKFGFSPDVAGYRVWSRQCPALDFVRRTAGGGANSPFLLLKSMRVGSGDTLSGEIRNAGDRALTMLLVQEDGTVRNVSSALKPNRDAQTFDLRNDARSSSVPQLLIVIASAHPLADAAPRAPVDAATFFPGLLDGAAKGQALSIDTKLFLLGG